VELSSQGFSKVDLPPGWHLATQLPENFQALESSCRPDIHPSLLARTQAESYLASNLGPIFASPEGEWRSIGRTDNRTTVSHLDSLSLSPCITGHPPTRASPNIHQESYASADIVHQQPLSVILNGPLHPQPLFPAPSSTSSTPSPSPRASRKHPSSLQSSTHPSTEANLFLLFPRSRSRHCPPPHLLETYTPNQEGRSCLRSKST
jgi:hypothetical protein